MTSSGHPPGPRLSALGALLALRRDPIGLFERAASFGDVSHLRLPGVGLYVVNDPELVHRVLTAGDRGFRKGPTMDAATLLLGQSLLTSSGEYHKRHRRLMQPIFHHDRIRSYAATMVELALRARERWQEGEPLDVHAEMSALTLAIVGRTLFASDIEAAEARDVAVAMREVLAQFDRAFSPFLQLSQRLPLPANRRFEAAKTSFDSTIRTLIARRRAAGLGGDDVLSLLLRARDEEAGLTDEQVRDEALTLFLAGHETTANALTWTWYLLGRHRDVEERLHAELEGILGERNVHAEDVPALACTRSVLAESMRLYPPAWAIGRRATEDHELGGYRVPSGSIVVVSPWLVHHDERWWPEASAFRPERWEDPDKQQRRTYLPFGAGPRMCIGEDFARLESVLVLATVAQRWRFEPDPTHRVELQPVVTLRPRTGVRVTALMR
jgi:cytochrome P450